MYAWSFPSMFMLNSTIYSLLDCHSIGTAPESNDEGNEREGWKEKGASGIEEARALRTGRCGTLVHSQEHTVHDCENVEDEQRTAHCSSSCLAATCAFAVKSKKHTHHRKHHHHHHHHLHSLFRKSSNSKLNSIDSNRNDAVSKAGL